MSTTTYRSVQISPNFTSIHGTGRRLNKQRGWQLVLPGYGRLGWHSSMKDAKAFIDGLHKECSPQVRRALDAAEQREAATV